MVCPNDGGLGGARALPLSPPLTMNRGDSSFKKSQTTIKDGTVGQWEGNTRKETHTKRGRGIHGDGKAEVILARAGLIIP